VLSPSATAGAPRVAEPLLDPAIQGFGRRSEREEPGPVGHAGLHGVKKRGKLEAAEYKHVVLGLVFLKYVTDAFETRREWLEAATARTGSEAATDVKS
jgi:hypothetical protein